ncbi:hypothetical protein diail_5797 [Diaporthe ilicicola]|nr:hypothetical protein diail_5797 [Diaporthe ilicicola]
MGAETGATTSIFPYTEQMGKYLDSTFRSNIRASAEAFAHNLRADPDAEYDHVINIDLSDIEPFINGPSTPDLATPISRFKSEVDKHGWPKQVSAGLIGSCTNSSFEDMTRAADLAKQALAAGLKPQAPLFISPGSESTRATLEEAGVLGVFEDAHATMLANACGPCCGSWDRTDMEKSAKGTSNSIVTSFNRNFTGRLDSNPATSIFLASPETVIVKAFSGKLDFDPRSDSIGDFRFEAPTAAPLPEGGYARADHVFTAPPANHDNVEVVIAADSQRIQRLAPFRAWDGADFVDLPILIKVEGKCTTDHITPAGPWFRYRGHLENISNNTLIGTVNSENKKVNSVRNVFTNEYGSVPETAKDYKRRGQQWVIVADHNYGEGSSREHAALQPRFLNGVAVIAKSFARIHESNLKKQGMLPLTFSNTADYDRLKPDDRVSLVGLGQLSPGQPVTMIVNGSDGSWEAALNHTFNEEQVAYFRAGSALNLMALKAGHDQEHAKSPGR